MTTEEIINALREPAKYNLIHWRAGATNKKRVQKETGNPNARATKGIAFGYVNARDVMKRLDTVIGAANWQTDFVEVGGTVCCKLSLKLDGEWITKTDGAGKTSVEGDKGQYSDALKRAAAQWGIFRYLYYLPDVWCDLDKYGNISNPPALPDWALPKPKEATTNG